MRRLFYYYLILLFFGSCHDNTTIKSDNFSSTLADQSRKETASVSDYFTNVLSKLDLKRQLIKLSHHINTSANEYLPVLSEDENKMYFSAMDRTGFFDFKQDFTKQKSSGGEDVFFSECKDGIWTDARPISSLNTNSHETVSQILKNKNLLLTANYTERLGPKIGNKGAETTDLFLAKSANTNNFQILHFPEPVNSIFNEADGLMAEDESYILFVSDRPGHVGDYHKKGWKWNSSFWGNTDVYVSTKEGDFWSVPLNLGKTINTAGAERTPWLSSDGLTLYLSSNGHETNKTDLNVYAFKRLDKTNWTDWQGPIAISDANSDSDDWGYRETKGGDAYISRAIPVGFKSTQVGSAGDGGIRETNFRTGYELYGQQTAALNADKSTDIFLLKKMDQPVFTFPDIFFDLNSAIIKPKVTKTLERLVDLIKQNKNYAIEIKGFTDNKGNPDFNLNLSQKRADAVKDFLLSHDVSNTITAKGFGASNLKFKTDKLQPKNRRVEIYFVTKE